MPVKRTVSVAVLNDDGVAVTAATAGQKHFAISGRLDRGAARCCVIHTFVGADLVQDRVLAARGEARADAGKIYGCADKCLAHAVAISGVVIADALLVGVTHGSEGFAAVGEAGREDIAGTNGFAVDHFLLVDHFKLVAWANVLGEVDVVAEHLGHIHRGAVRQARALARNRQGAADHAVCIRRAHGWLGRYAAKGIAFGGFVEGDGLKVADLAVQLVQLLAVGAHFKFEFLAVLELAELLGLFVASQYFVDGGRGQADLLEQG